MEDSVKSTDCIEKLAHKYMQKCIVESSTESESESNTEVLPSPVAGGLKKARNAKGQQFLDPYDGDSEDASIHSDCSLNSSNSVVTPQVNSTPKAVALEDAGPSEDGALFSKPSNWCCPEMKISEIHAQRVNDCKAPLEFPSQENDFPRNLLQPSELTRGTEALTSMWLTPDPSLLMSINPSACADLLASPDTSAPQPMLADDCDTTMCKEPLIKRKQGLPVSEGAGEKQRKKLRAT
ncbi:uncharacterized protein LOC112989941 [Dromaius novaehollandiae]|uniref:uncharacterized protein LOC112989941 n=1 Tax=Dromaius novaehollandiae TaxID=8790 RepID=UPI000E1FB015|nr:uncharacterized protein LOC112989941 [Dromaius novaehollandiae]XP_025967158.1 uncharacterized protein LOC112989941 [Dromaius novaehollandiae]